MSWLLNIPILILAGAVLRRLTKNDMQSRTFGAALLVRILGGLVFAYVATEVYPGDSISYVQTTNALLSKHSVLTVIAGGFEVFSDNPRSVFFVQLISPVVYLASGSFWITTLYVLLISFSASLYFFNQFSRLYPTHRTVAMICIFFIPSIIFWSSGVLKDALSYSLLMIVVSVVLNTSKGKRVAVFEWILAMLSLIILYKLKHYLFITALLFVGLSTGIMLFRKLSGLARWSLSFATVLICIIFTQFVHPYLTFDRISQTIYENNQTIILRTESKSLSGVVVENPSWPGVLSEVPPSLYHGLFGPSLFDETPPLGLLHKLENTLLFSLTFFSILLIIKDRPKIDWFALSPAILCIAMLATLLALTTPNFGTLVRYKVAFLPYLFILVSILPFHYLSSKTEG